MDHIQGLRTHHSQRPWPRWSAGWARPTSSGRSPGVKGGPGSSHWRKRAAPPSAACTGLPSPAVRPCPAAVTQRLLVPAETLSDPALRPTHPYLTPPARASTPGLGAGSRARAPSVPTLPVPWKAMWARGLSPGRLPRRLASRCPSGDREGGLGLVGRPGGFRGGKIPTWRRPRANEPFE